MESIFGEAFNIETKKPKTKDLVDKISNPEEAEVDIDKMLKSKKLSIEDRLALINENVLTILGKQRANVIVIRDKQTFQDYIHLGGSCKYQDGCNNISPMQVPLMIKIVNLPAEIDLKLWKNNPSSKYSKADIYYKIRFEQL